MKITSAESLVMEVLWRSSAPVTAEEIRDALPDENWTTGTVRKLLTRLANKNAVEAIMEKRRSSYRPLVERSDYAHAEGKNLIDRLFGGEIEPFVALFSDRETLTDTDLAKLRQLIERLDREK